jgi:hypothetical protein
MRYLFIILMALGLATGATAEEEGLGQGQERHLGGHGFLPSAYVSEPWVSTSFQNYTGGGAALDLKTPFLDLEGTELFTLEGNLFYANLGMAFQQKLGERFAVGMRVDALIRTGTNAQTLVTEGANVDRMINAWCKYRLVRTDASQFTVGLDWEYRKTLIVTPWEFALGIIEGDDLEDGALLYSVKNWTARLTMDYAHAFSPTFGLRANGAIGLYEEPLTNSVAKATHRMGVLGEMDLKPRSDIPLGITLGYTKGFPENDPGAGLSGVLLGFWYTGKEAFVVGVETGYMTLPLLDQDEKVNAVFGLFSVRYYF